ncbi:hypothetical protein Tco_0559389 [Tanacetum coccineum]
MLGAAVTLAAYSFYTKRSQVRGTRQSSERDPRLAGVRASVPSEVVPSEVSPSAPQLRARMWFSFDYFGASMLLTPDLNHPSIVQLSLEYCFSIGCLYHKYLRRSKLIVTASFEWSGGLLQKSALDVCSRGLLRMSAYLGVVCPVYLWD